MRLAAVNPGRPASTTPADTEGQTRQMASSHTRTHASVSSSRTDLSLYNVCAVLFQIL